MRKIKLILVNSFFALCCVPAVAHLRVPVKMSLKPVILKVEPLEGVEVKSNSPCTIDLKKFEGVIPFPKCENSKVRMSSNDRISKISYTVLKNKVPIFRITSDEIEILPEFERFWKDRKEVKTDWDESRPENFTLTYTMPELSIAVQDKNDTVHACLEISYSKRGKSFMAVECPHRIIKANKYNRFRIYRTDKTFYANHAFGKYLKEVKSYEETRGELAKIKAEAYFPVLEEIRFSRDSCTNRLFSRFEAIVEILNTKFKLIGASRICPEYPKQNAGT